jgi:hypothetical protein
MDPYIETPEIWSDFHSDLAGEIRARLNQIIQPRYVARLIPYVTYEIIEVAQARGVRPDVGVWQPQPPCGAASGGVAVITPAPDESRVPLELPLRLQNVEIRETRTHLLVTAIEILSPVNKRRGHEAHEEYLRKRRDLLRASVHLMEIDLLRGGERPPLEVPVTPAPYYVLLSRADRRPKVEVWPIQLADRLPVPPVPLLEPDPDAALDLGTTVASIYERGAYAALIDYRQPPPPPPLSPAETAWVNDLLIAKRSEA